MVAPIAHKKTCEAETPQAFVYSLMKANYFLGASGAAGAAAGVAAGAAPDFAVIGA